MSSKRRVFITGTERGLGRSLVKVIHQKHPQLEVHITARNKAQECTEEWQKTIPKTDFRVYQLELRDTNNIKELVQRFKKDNIRFDYIIANAGFGVDFGEEKPSFAVAEETLKTNFDSTVDFIKQFLPLLAKDGRVVVVSSVMGALKEQGESIRHKLQNKDISQQELFKLSDQYIKAAKQQKMGDFNWSAYRTSKALLNCWSRFILPKLLKEGQTVVTMHPGACKTAMGEKDAELSPEQGAKRIFDSMQMKEVKEGCFYNNKFCDYEQCQ